MPLEKMLHGMHESLAYDSLITTWQFDLLPGGLPERQSQRLSPVHQGGGPVEDPFFNKCSAH